MIVGERFENRRVLMSGLWFERCEFVGCELVYSGGRVHLVENRFEGCRWSLEGAAAEALGLVRALCRDSEAFGAVLARTLGLVREEGDRPDMVAG